MKVIPSFVHGIIDYIGGIVLLLAPNIFGFEEVGGAAVMIPRVLGIIVILQALCTDYELGIFRMLSMRAHLVNDYVLAAFLAISPWLFGFSVGPQNQWMPHVIVGIALFVVGLMSQPYVSTRRTTAHGAI